MQIGRWTHICVRSVCLDLLEAICALFYKSKSFEHHLTHYAPLLGLYTMMNSKFFLETPRCHDASKKKKNNNNKNNTKSVCLSVRLSVRKEFHYSHKCTPMAPTSKNLRCDNLKVGSVPTSSCIFSVLHQVSSRNLKQF